MKSALLIVSCLLAMNHFALAHPYEPPIVLVPGAENVFLAKVTAIHGDSVTFTIEAVLRGESVETVVLKPDTESKGSYPLESEWLLSSCSLGYSKDSIGMPMEGYCGWIPNPIVQENGQPFVKTGPISTVFGVTTDKAQDGTQGLTLDHLKSLLRTSQKKP